VDGNSKKIYLKVEINHENFAEKETFDFKSLQHRIYS
jgi:hypothetical protein